MTAADLNGLNADQLRSAARQLCKQKGLPSSWTVNADKAACTDFLVIGEVPAGQTQPANPVGIAGFSEVSIPPIETPTPTPGNGPGDEIDQARKLLDILRGGKGSATTAEIEKVRAEFTGKIDDLAGKISGMDFSTAAKAEIDKILAGDAAKATRLPVAHSVATKPSGILAKVAPYYRPGKCMAGTIFALCSPPGFGKSHSVRVLGESYGEFLEHGCSPDLDEISTMLGTVAPDGSGGFLIVDGVLVQAVRQASTGKNVLLFLDEIWRLNPKCQEWLLSFLTGKWIKGVLWWEIRTKQIVGGCLEIIRCKAENLHLICAGNLTGNVPQPAFWSRFKIERIEFTVALAIEHATELLTKFGVSEASIGARTTARAIELSRVAFKSGLLQFSLDFRGLIRACVFAENPTWNSVKKVLADSVHDTCVSWDSDSGDCNGISAAEAKRISDFIRAN